MNRKQKNIPVLILLVLLLSSCSTHDAIKIKPFKAYRNITTQKMIIIGRTKKA